MNDWYLVDSKLRASTGMVPFVSLEYTTPDPLLALRTYDQTSDYFKDTGRIRCRAMSGRGTHFAFPQTIRRVVGA